MNVKNIEKKLPLGTKFGYGVGDFAFNLAYQTTALYLLFFFTDVFGIAAGTAGLILFASKLWDAVSDPLMGYISDHTKTRWGRKRPYLLFAAVPLAISIYLLFFSPNISAPSDKHLYALFTFILFCTIITIANVPYGALTADLTQDSHERSVLTGYRMIFAIMGTLLAAGATLPLVGIFGGGDQAMGFRMTGGAYGIIIALLILVTFATVKERRAALKLEKVSFAKNFRVIVQNKPFLILAVGTILNLTAILTTAAVVNYFFKYNLEREDLIPIAFLCLLGTATLFIPPFIYLSRITSKKFAYNVGMGSFVCVLILLFFFGEKDIRLTLLLFVIGGIGMATNWLSPWAMIPDTVEYSQWKTGVRREGVIYGAFFFAQKFPAALGAFIAGTILKLSGYVANVAQSPESLQGIKLSLTLVPAGFIILGITCISFFPIDADLHRTIREEIDNKK
jgi:GPH family glycoside/pentoside/hexuronide:cation symporter